MVFNEKDQADSIIFVKRGAIRVDKEITLDHTNYWPVDYKHWEVNTTKTKKVRTILKLKEGDYIGIKEIEE